MTTSIDYFVDNIRADVPRCPDPALENALRDAICDFCQKTWIVQRDFVYNSTTVTTYEELPDAPYLEFDGVRPTVPDIGMRPVVVIGAYVTEEHDDEYTQLILLPQRKIATRPMAFWESQTTNGLPSHYFPVAPDAIRVYPVPSIEYYLSMKVAFKPERDATEFDDMLYDDWLEEIASGAKCRLFAMPGKPWTDYNISEYERVKLNHGIGRARMAISNGFSSFAPTVTPGKFTF